MNFFYDNKIVEPLSYFKKNIINFVIHINLFYYIQLFKIINFIIFSYLY
jgi:hypothetical protein